MKFLVFVLLAIIMVGAASASTVTLTGTCYSGIINDKNNYIQFNLTNSGDGAATNLVITPIMEGAIPNNTTITIPTVEPNTTYAERIYLWNFTTVGSYVERFSVRYSQGTEQFTTVFPCLAYFFKGAQSQLVITGMGRNSSHIFVNVSNVGSYPINSIVTVYAPPSFSVAPQSKSLLVDSHHISNTSFIVVPPQYSNAEFPIAVGVSYLDGGVHYATMAITTINFAATQSTIPHMSTGTILLLGGLIAAIVLILILIVYSVIRNRQDKEKRSREAENNSER